MQCKPQAVATHIAMRSIEDDDRNIGSDNLHAGGQDGLPDSDSNACMEGL